MLSDLIPFDEILDEKQTIDRAYRAVMDLLRKKLGVTIGYDVRQIPFSDPSILDEVRFAELLLRHQIITSYHRGKEWADEVPYFSWAAFCNEHSNHQTAGASFESNGKALIAALAESLERYLWFTQEDYFEQPVYATEAEIARKGAHIPLTTWSGFSEKQRQSAHVRILRPDARYLWIKARSLTSGKHLYVPAQLMSGKRSRERHLHQEPVIRYANTNGLATWPTKVGAHIAGIAELIERESYMVTWLNQLTLPRIDLSTRATNDPLLAHALAQCKRYRLNVHAVRMITDAPIHPVYVVLEDEGTLAPRFTIGLNAHRSLNRALLKATTEALRARRGYRTYFENGNTYDPGTPSEQVGHRDRLYYWGIHAKDLEFLTRGTIAPVLESPWEHETDDAYFARLMSWCITEHLDCLSVSLGKSKKNPTPLHIEMVAIPQLVPTYLRESERAFGSERLRSLPIKFGYAPRTEPFTRHPHPFS